MSLQIAIIGATGYTGSELVRLLKDHPDVTIQSITSESYRGQKFSDVHPQFLGIEDQVLVSAQEAVAKNPDVLFLALPHGVSMSYVKDFGESQAKIIDLSGDFRLSTPQVYESWYHKEHIYPQGFDKAAYGLPELHKEAITSANLVANPGCYPTSGILATAPLIKAGLIDPNQVIVDAKSGITGAGAKAKDGNMYSNVNENFKAYKLKNHRHTVEIEEQLSGVGGQPATVQFTPHLLPIDRGILATVYAQPTPAAAETQDLTSHLQKVYQEFYQDAPFVRMRTSGPGVKDVRGSNFCDIFVTYDERTNRIIALAAIDNLVKGAAGQAMHNMNLMCGLPETRGFTGAPLKP